MVIANNTSVKVVTGLAFVLTLTPTSCFGDRGDQLIKKHANLAKKSKFKPEHPCAAHKGEYVMLQKLIAMKFNYWVRHIRTENDSDFKDSTFRKWNGESFTKALDGGKVAKVRSGMSGYFYNSFTEKRSELFLSKDVNIQLNGEVLDYFRKPWKLSDEANMGLIAVPNKRKAMKMAQKMKNGRNGPQKKLAHMLELCEWLEKPCSGFAYPFEDKDTGNGGTKHMKPFWTEYVMPGDRMDAPWGFAGRMLSQANVDCVENWSSRKAKDDAEKQLAKDIRRRKEERKRLQEERKQRRRSYVGKSDASRALDLSKACLLLHVCTK